MRTRGRPWTALLVAALSLPGAASAQAPNAAPPNAAPPNADALEAAKQLFLRGNERLEAKDNEAALDLFQRSRALVPAIANTTNAAIALERLGRLDEALALYEQLLSTFASRMSPDEQRAVSAKIAELRGQIGLLEVSSNLTGGMVVIDGKRRGNVPLPGPIRLPPGWHTVRVLREGYTPAEGGVQVEPGRSVRVEVNGGEALVAVGRLSVTEASGARDLEVVVDGSPLGFAPWEGSLGPGRHVVWLRGREAGTGPVEVNVVAGQTTPLPLRAQPLGPTLRVEVEPRSAHLVVDGVDVARGSWEGRLPQGNHAVVAWEEGYTTGRVDFTPGGSRQVHVTLAVDEEHPRWGQGKRAHIGLEAVLGAAVGPGLGSEAEASCSTCSSSGGASGGAVGARFAYVLPAGIRLEAGGGYMKVGRSFERQIGASPTYVFDDKIRLSGPYASLGLGYGHPIAPKTRLLGRLSLGVFFARASDTVGATAAMPGQASAPFTVQNSGRSAAGATVLATPEVGVVREEGSLSLGLSLGMSFFLLDGPRLALGETGPQAAPSGPCTPGAVACVKGSDVIASERAYGRFFMLVPQLSAGWQF